jgi:GT2 family glycosyltransferase
MNKENPLVSIIVRTKDRPALLKGALRSIAAQIYRPIEVVLVNDGGCDLDIEEIKNILVDINLNYIRLEKNSGRATAANVGIENSKGDYMGFLDDDDEFYPDHLKVLIETLAHSSCKIAYTDAETSHVEFDRDGNVTEKNTYVDNSQDFSPNILIFQNYIPFMCLLFDREVLDETRFNEHFEIFEDWVLLIDLSNKYWFKHIKKVTAKYIQWSDESQINRRALIEEFSQEAYKKVLSQNIDRISPEMIYAYCVYSATEKRTLFNKLEDKDYEHTRVKMEFMSELALLKSEKQKVEGEKQRIADEKQAIEHEKQAVEHEKQRIEHEKDNLLQELMNYRNFSMDLSTSLGWKAIERYRRLKDKTVPLGTKRRAFYELMLKSIKVIGQEGMSGFIARVKRRSTVHVSYMKSKFRLHKSNAVQITNHTKVPMVYNFVQKPVHIIMPLYNGYECLKDCIDSIYRNTDLSFHSLIIIDDKSSDSRISHYLMEMRKTSNNKNITILNNETNLGFAKTINRGMKFSPEDVIILNSDTIVTKNWVTKLQRAVYSKPRIATATPLSNYVTINGIPKPFQYNSIPNGMDIDAFADFLEKISFRYYPEIPSGVGFCMYIKRSVLDDIGYFDEERFGKGYAEETDFCMRALKKGYTHVIDDTNYIYHIGGVSFESVKDPAVLREKNLMIEKNLETLKALHPEYNTLVEKALEETLAPVHELINFRIRLMENNGESPLCHRSEA